MHVHPLWRYCETCSCCSASSLKGRKATTFAPKWEGVDAVAFIQSAVSDQQVATTIFHTFCSRMTRHFHHGFVLRCLERKRRRNISSVIGEDVLAISSKGLKIDDISQRSFYYQTVTGHLYSKYKPAKIYCLSVRAFQIPTQTLRRQSNSPILESHLFVIFGRRHTMLHFDY